MIDDLDNNPLGLKVRPDALTLDMIVEKAGFASQFGDWLRERKNRRMIPHRFEQCGYVPVRNDGREDGLYVVNGKRQAVYAKIELSVRERFEAVKTLLKDIETAAKKAAAKT